MTDLRDLMAADKKERNPVIAVLLSFLVLGLGHMYNGRLAKGAIIYAAVQAFEIALGLTGIIHYFLGLCAMELVSIVLRIAIAVDAALGASRSREIELKPYNRWYFYVIIAALSTYVVGPLVGPVVGPVLKNYVFQAYPLSISSRSMEPALLIGDHVIVSKVRPYKAGTMPKRGDLVVFPFPEDPTKMWIKRIIALEGEKLEIRAREVYINDNRLGDPWRWDPWGQHGSNRTIPGTESPRDNLSPVVVPKGCVFVMGDNRDFSYDSRFFGFVGVKNIEAKPLYIYWSKNWSRIGKTIR